MGDQPGTVTCDEAVAEPPHDRSAPSRQLRKKLRTRTRILDAANALFARQGYELTTVQEIAEQADIAVRTFYYHFDSKAALAVAWFEEWADDLGEALSCQPADATPLELVGGALDAMAEQGYPGAVTWQDDEGRPTMPPPVWALLEEADPALAGLVYRRLAAGYRRLSDLFRVRLGYGDDAWEPYVIASAVLALWFVAIHGSHGRIDRGSAPPSFHDTVRQAFDAYTGGLARLWEGRPATGGTGGPGGTA